MTLRASAASFVVLIAALSCRTENTHRPEIPALPTFAYRGFETRSVLEVPPAMMREVVANTYRVHPDSRFLGAVAEAHHLMSGLPSEKVTATFKDGTWVVEYAGERVGELPELAGFDDAHTLLAAWSTRLLKQFPLDSRAPDAERLQVARDSVGGGRLADIVAGLRIVDAEWSRTHRLELLLLASRGLTRMAARVPEVEVLGDPISARALATSTLAEAAGSGDSVAHWMALLAGHMGYTTEAAIAGAPHRPEFETEATEIPGNLREQLDTIAASQKTLMQTIRELVSRKKPVPPEWSDLLRSDDGGHQLVAFEEQVGGVAERLRGPFIDSDLARAYFRAQMHQAFERRCNYFIDELSSIERGTEFAKQFASPPPGLWTETAGWCRHRAGVSMSQTPLDSSVADIRNVASMSDDALEGTFDDVTKDRAAFPKPWQDIVADLDIARAVFSRLDSRPTGLRRAGDVAEHLLFDVPLEEHYLERVLALAGGENPHLTVWYADHMGDTTRLAALANDTSLKLDARLDALQVIGQLGADSAVMRARYRRLLAEDPSDWTTRGEYISEELKPAGRFADAAEIAREWLAANPEGDTFDHIFAVTTLAGLYQSMGQTRKAWDVMQPIVGSYQLGAMTRGAEIALALGDTATAGEIARRVVNRYPNSAHSRISLALVRWAQGDDAGAAAALTDPNHVMSADDWQDPIAPKFVHAFARRPISRAVAAVLALVAAGADETTLLQLPDVAMDSGRRELAVALGEQLLDPGHSRVVYPAFYSTLKAARGERVALAWLAAKWPPPHPALRWWDIYRVRRYDLLWTLTTEPAPGTDTSSFWMLRTLGELRKTKPAPARWRQLVAYYNRTPRDGPYELAGQFLVGRATETELLSRADTPQRRTEDGYYLGVKALSEGRYEDASAWLRVAIETRQVHEAEFVLAKELLERWTESQKSLERGVVWLRKL